MTPFMDYNDRLLVRVSIMDGGPDVQKMVNEEMKRDNINGFTFLGEQEEQTFADPKADAAKAAALLPQPAQQQPKAKQPSTWLPKQLAQKQLQHQPPLPPLPLKTCATPCKRRYARYY